MGIFGSMIPRLVGSGPDRHITMFLNQNISSILLPNRVGCISRLSMVLESFMTTRIRYGSHLIQNSFLHRILNAFFLANPIINSTFYFEL